MVRYVAEVTLGPQQRSVPSWGISWGCALPPAFSEDPLLFLDPSRKTAWESLMGNSGDDYNGGQLVVVAVIFLVLTYISVFLRFFVRLVITKSFSADDWLMLAAQVFRILATCREAQTHIFDRLFLRFLALSFSEACTMDSADTISASLKETESKHLKYAEITLKTWSITLRFL
jgi:hypothetical protein